MSTDYQQARETLGIRLRELRLTAAGGPLTGPQLAQRLGWQHSKVYKLENGRQTARAEDLTAWATAVGRPDAAEELLVRLRGFESHIRSWRRQLAAGHRPVQDTWNVAVRQARTLHVWEEAVIPGMLQTAEYVRHTLLRYAELYGTRPDTEEAVRSRIRRQDWLYESGHRLHALVWEAALHTLICPPSVLAGQLDRLAAAVGMDTVELGVIPLAAPLKVPPASGFWVLDERVAVTEDWHSESWVDDTETVAMYLRVWRSLRQAAVVGAEAQAVIGRAQRSAC
ncbi:helix-turn-helix domain-containing protein [Streptomyces roseolus]|uniref:helix-turn-helix domain-containing protein n=1 Tax=Streptomyces roseolus TaxID=67358 RepID=UPI003794DC6D